MVSLINKVRVRFTLEQLDDYVLKQTPTEKVTLADVVRFVERELSLEHKLPIRPSTGCLRFYLSDKWNSNLIQEYFTEHANVRLPHPEDTNPYYIIDNRSIANLGKSQFSFKNLDMEKICAGCTIIHPTFWSKREHDRTDEEILRAYLA